MSTYQRLADFLAGREGNQWDASFEDIETTLGRPLPQSAYRYPAWWANQSGAGHSQTRGWRSVGWRTTRLDLERRRVTFERERDTSSVLHKHQPSHGTDELVLKASRLTGITDRDQLITEALRSLIAREAARALIELGGSMPDYRAPERERL